MERGGRNASTSIANFSLGGNGDPSSSTGLALGAALHDLYQYCDVMVFAAAGNSHSSACQTLPAALILPSQGRVLAIGATNSNDELADFSNFGSCVAMHGPGVGNRGAWNTGDTAQTTASGTSFSSPTAAGVASLHLQQRPADYHELASQLPVYIPFSDRIAHKMLHDAIGVVEGVPASTTIGLIHITSTALDPFGEMSPLSPTTPITSSDGSCLEVYLFAAMLIVLVTISTT
jgi:subtilisin family serine protease